MKHDDHEDVERSDLRFAETVLREFRFLERHDYTVQEKLTTLVRYVRGNQSVRVYHGRQSFELGVEVCRSIPIRGRLEDECYHLGYFFRAACPESAPWPSPAARTAEAVAMFVAQLATQTRLCAMPSILGDERQFDDVRELARQDGVLTREAPEASRLRMAAESAWHSEDFEEVARLYETLDHFEMVELKPSEAKRLQYARNRVSESRGNCPAEDG